jgi:sugar/nucleoside kinase (ribokinase family)
MASTRAYPTSQTVILLVENQDRRYLHAFGANQAFTVDHIDRQWVSGLRLLYVGGLFAMPGVRTEALGDLLRFCRSRGIVTVVDVVIPQQGAAAGEMALLLPHVDYFLPNDDEARRLTGCRDPMDQLHSLRAQGVQAVVITRGQDGALAGRGGEFWRCPTYPVQVLDPSGSGDAFAAGIITGALAGWDMPATLRYASALGASATRAIGTTDGVFTADEAEAFVAARTLEVAHGTLRP